eukprot:scpid38493/ scgid19836/ Cytospin-A; SPECC1-like protein; Sperm antigen with calponin homology and coiled-coil domains 1-like
MAESRGSDPGEEYYLSLQGPGRQFWPEVGADDSVFSAERDVREATRQARQPTRRGGGRVAAIASQFQAVISGFDSMKGRSTRKFSSIADRIEAFTKASGSGSSSGSSTPTSTAKSTTASPRTTSASARVVGMGTGSAQSPARANSPIGRGSAASKIPTAASSRANRSVSTATPPSQDVRGPRSSSPSSSSSSSLSSSSSSSPAPVSLRGLAKRSVSTAAAPSSSSLSSSPGSSSGLAHPRQVARHMSEPVTAVRSAGSGLVHPVSPVLRSSPANTPPSLPKSSPPALPTSSPPPTSIRTTSTPQGTPPLPKAPIPNYSPSSSKRSSPSTSGRSSPTSSRRKPSNLAVTRHLSQPAPVMRDKLSIGAGDAKLHKSKSTSDEEVSMYSSSSSNDSVTVRQPRLNVPAASDSSRDVVGELIPLSRASSGKSPRRRDGGCESSESINGSPELSPPMSSLPGGSVFGTADTKGTPSEDDTTLSTSSGSSLSDGIVSTRSASSRPTASSASTSSRMNIRSSSTSSKKGSPSVTKASPSAGDAIDMELQQTCAERDHLQLVLKKAEMQLFAVEKERHDLIKKNNKLQEELEVEEADSRSSTLLWKDTREHAIGCIQDGRNFFLQQESPVWHSVMVDLLDETLAVLGGALPAQVPASTCSNAVGESLQRQLETISKQLEEARRERRALTDKSQAWDRERRQLQVGLTSAQQRQTSVQSDSSEQLARKEQQLRDLQSKCKLLEHEKEREVKQARLVGSRAKTLELSLETARQDILQANQQQHELSRQHEGELSILRNTIRDIRREKGSKDDSWKKQMQTEREQYELKLRDQKAQIQQLEDETDELTQKLQEVEEETQSRTAADASAHDSPDGGSGRHRQQQDVAAKLPSSTRQIDELTRKIDKLADDLVKERAMKLQMQARIEKLESEKTTRSSQSAMASSNSPRVTPMTSRESSPGVSSQRNYSSSPLPARGSFLAKASPPTQAAGVQRTVAPPSSLSTSQPVQARSHTGARPQASSTNRHTISEFSSHRSQSDEQTSSQSTAHLLPKFGRHFGTSNAATSPGTSKAVTPGSPSMTANIGTSPGLNHWKKLSSTVQAASKFQVKSKRGALLQWCKQHLNCENVDIQNFHRSWRNGIAFCALLEHFQPGTIDVASLDPNNMAYNLNLAFDEGEKIGISKLLDTEDIVEMEQPEWRSVMTYVSAVYNHFHPKK